MTETPEEMYKHLSNVMTDGRSIYSSNDALALINHYRNQVQVLREALEPLTRAAGKQGFDYHYATEFEAAWKALEATEDKWGGVMTEIKLEPGDVLTDKEWEVGDKVVSSQDDENDYEVAYKNESFYVVTLPYYPAHTYLVPKTGEWVSLEGYSYTFTKKPKRLSGWVNVYANGHTGSVFKTKEEAVEFHKTGEFTRIACIDLSQFEEGHGL